MAERSDFQCLCQDVETDGFAQAGDGQAAAVDGYRVAHGEFGCEGYREFQAGLISFNGEGDDRACGFDESGEHLIGLSSCWQLTPASSLVGSGALGSLVIPELGISMKQAPMIMVGIMAALARLIGETPTFEVASEDGLSSGVRSIGNDSQAASGHRSGEDRVFYSDGKIGCLGGEVGDGGVVIESCQ